MSVIQIKRSPNVAAPTTDNLATSELGYSQDKSNDGAGAILYIESLDNGNNPVIHKIGGKFYTDQIDSANAELVVSTIVKRDALGNFSANTITANINGAIEEAQRLQTVRYFNLTGDAVGTAAFDGTANADIAVSVEFANVAIDGGTY